MWAEGARGGGLPSFLAVGVPSPPSITHITSRSPRTATHLPLLRIYLSGAAQQVGARPTTGGGKHERQLSGKSAAAAAPAAVAPSSCGPCARHVSVATHPKPARTRLCTPRLVRHAQLSGGGCASAACSIYTPLRYRRGTLGPAWSTGWRYEHLGDGAACRAAGRPAGRRGGAACRAAGRHAGWRGGGAACRVCGPVGAFSSLFHLHAPVLAPICAPPSSDAEGITIGGHVHALDLGAWCRCPMTSLSHLPVCSHVCMHPASLCGPHAPRILWTACKPAGRQRPRSRWRSRLRSTNKHQTPISSPGLGTWRPGPWAQGPGPRPPGSKPYNIPWPSCRCDWPGHGLMKKVILVHHFGRIFRSSIKNPCDVTKM
jgi:hypothetical protein